MMKKSLLWLMIIWFVVGLQLPVEADQIPPDQNTVGEGQSVDRVFLYGKDGVISGQVREIVVVINGNLTLTSTANVKDRVLIIGGNIVQEPGAQVGRGIMQLDLKGKNLNSLLLAGAAFIGLEVVKILLAIFIVLASIIYLFLAKNKVAKARDSIEKQLVKVGILGILAGLGITLCLTALAVTIIGIPLAILLALIIILLAPIGFTALGLILGKLMLGHTGLGKTELSPAFFGSLIIIAFLISRIRGIVGNIVNGPGVGALAMSIMPEKIWSKA